MSNVRYPVVRCFNPRRIVNPYTHESMVVPCGHCRACALQRSNYLALWCDLESQSHKYCMFVTLTFANRFIPRAQILDSVERPFGHDLVTSDGEILGPCDISQSEIDAFLKKVYLFGYVPYLDKSYLQKFLKRFRYYVSKTSKAKVRYFACGEYGPVHFRPHYHLLLWFDDDAILQVCEQAVLQAWPFGRCDVQLSKGSCSNYVAGYVNSSCALPKVLKARAIRPFVTHSSRLGYEVLQSQRKEIYECSARDFVNTSLLVNGKYREFSLWRAFYSYYFPKCKGYIDKPSYARLQSYRIYDIARQAFPGYDTPAKLARQVCACAYYFGAKPSTFQDKATREVVTYFYDYEACQQTDMSSDVFQKWVQRVYNELLLSRHFLYDLIGTPTIAACKSMLRRIEEFYAQLDYYHLTEFYETQSQFYLSNLYGSDDLMSFKDDDSLSFFPYFYDNVNYSLSDYKATPCYSLMTSEVMSEVSKRVKHKVLNDANLIFCSND